MPYCCVPGCLTPSTHGFKFPNEIELRELWTRNIQAKNLKVTKYTRVCSYHFESKFLINFDEYINTEGIFGK